MSSSSGNLPDNASGRSTGLDGISTRWSLLRQAHEGPENVARSAMADLVRRYSGAIRRYVGAVLGGDQDADELGQDVCVRMLAGDFAGATPDRGKFRHFLKTVIRNMAVNFVLARRRRAAGSLEDVEPADVAAVEVPSDEHWLAECRRTVLEATWAEFDRLRTIRVSQLLHTVLRLRTDYPADDSQALAERVSAAMGRRFGVDAVRQQLRRARLLFARLLAAQVAGGLYEPTPERVEEELIELGLLEYVRDFLPALRRETES